MSELENINKTISIVSIPFSDDYYIFEIDYEQNIIKVFKTKYDWFNYNKNKVYKELKLSDLYIKDYGILEVIRKVEYNNKMDKYLKIKDINIDNKEFVLVKLIIKPNL